ncbi:MAG: hypothetical protein IIB27_09590, partial [Chloroflexi bacterium]|nr:hypothetical protein [Chloroflexota bacterium]
MVSTNTKTVEDRFEEWRNVLHTQINLLDVDYKTWDAINRLNRASDHRFKAAPNFWNSVHRAYIERLIIGLWTLTDDNDSSSVSIKRLLIFCESNQAILFDTSAVSNRVEPKLSEADAFEKPFLLDIINRNHLDATKMDQIKQTFAGAGATVESLKGWRNKVLA